MNYVILDLEWTGSFCKEKDGYINEIIQFGAVKLDEQLNIIDEFESFVKPIFQKKISSRVTKLTSITEVDIANALNYMKVISNFNKWLDKDTILMTWSNSDIRIMLENHYLIYHRKSFPLSCKYVDLQKYCQVMAGISTDNQVALSDLARTIGIDVDNLELHKAVGDSILSAMCFKQVYKENTLDGFVRQLDKEYFSRLLFKASYITDLNNPLIDSKELYVNCPVCNKKLLPRDKWTAKNKHFDAHFYCANCEKNYVGRIIFKMTFDGLVVKKKANEFVKKSEEENVQLESVSEN